MKYRNLSVAGLALALSAFVGCSDNDQLAATNADHGVACDVIGELCHDVDSPAGRDCHEQAHLGSCSFASCVDTCVAADEGADADPRCAALGELCHPVADQSDALRACHELGHVNDGASCAANFDDCAARCLAARESLAEPPLAGAGGNGGEVEHEHEAGAAGHD